MVIYKDKYSISSLFPAPYFISQNPVRIVIDHGGFPVSCDSINVTLCKTKQGIETKKIKK